MYPSPSALPICEKAALLSGASFWGTHSIESAGIRSLTLTDGPHGVRMQTGTADHLGMNTSEPATAFPTAAATGSTWDPQLIEQMGAALGAEARQLGVDVLLGPGINIKRSPLGGRNFEYFSEDPLLSGALGAAWVRGIEASGVGASVKHFAANNQETDRMRVSVDVDERTLREIYLPAFERTIIDGVPATVMCSYNQINGVHAAENHWLLTTVLRDEWKYQGCVISDWGAVTDPVRSIAAGLDLEMPGTGDASPNAIVAAVGNGHLDHATVDQAAARVVALQHHIDEHRTAAAAPVNWDTHHQLARRIAAASMVLLRNEHHTLPLDPTTDQQIAVIGEFARTPRYQGAGSSHVRPTQLDTALDAITAASAGRVTFAAGYTLADGRDEDPALQAEALTAASAADIIILFLGLPPTAESEGFDREHIDLPESQRHLAREVIATNPKTIVVLSNGGVVAIDDHVNAAAAVLETWLAGQAGGSAVADVLFGAAEPTGRLAETIPISLSHTPAHANWPGELGHVVYGERVFVGYRWFDYTDRDVRYPFGYGLGYTCFEYSDLAVQVTPGVAAALVEFTVRNRGPRHGADVPQVYVADLESSVFRPLRELRGFEKVELDAGEECRVRIRLDSRAFAFWGQRGWTVEPGEFAIDIAAHSRDTRLSQIITLDIPAPLPVLTETSTVGEWLAHPRGKELIAPYMPAGAADGDLMGVDADKLLGGIPLRTMLGFAQQQAAEPFSVESTLSTLLKAAEAA